MSTRLLTRPTGSMSQGGRRRQATDTAASRIARAGVLLGLLVLIVYPLGALLAITLRDNEDGGLSLRNFGALGDPSLREAALNSLWVAAGTTVGSLVIALPLAWLAARTDLPGRRYLRNIVLLTFATPSFIAALGWVLLLGPRGGVLNEWLMSTFGLEEAPFNIFTPWGIIFVLTGFFYPLVFLSVETALENMDPQLEQAAAGQGAGTFRVLRTVTFPLVAPAILGGSLLVFVNAFITFGPVGILGTPVGFETVPTAIFRLLAFPPRIETAAVLMVPVLVLIITLLIIQGKLIGDKAFTTVGGKHGPRAHVKLGKWKIPAVLYILVILLLSLLLPFGMLAAMSFKRAIGLPFSADNFTLTENYLRVFQSRDFLVSFLNSTLLATSAVLAGTMLAFFAAWLVSRTSSRLNAFITTGVYAPMAVSGAAMGIALIIAYSGRPFGASGVTLLFLAYAGSVLPLMFTYINAGMTQVGAQLEEASRSLGAGWLRTWRRVSVPLLRSTIIGAALLNFVMLFRDLETSIFLYNGTNPTVAVLLYQMSSEALYQRMGALAIVVLAVNTLIVLAIVRWQQR